MLSYVYQTVSSYFHMFSVQVSLAVAMGFYIIHLKTGSWNKKLPPGPMALPIIGNLIQLSKNDHTYELFCEWRKQYGDVFMVKIGPKPAVVLNSYTAIREALVTKQNDFAGRPHIFSMDLFTSGGKDIAFGDFGPVWQMQRKLAHQAFRKFASGDHLEVLLSAAVGRLVDTLDTAAANLDAVTPIELLSAYTMDLQSVLCFGLEVLDEEDSVFTEIRNELEHIDEKFGKGLMADFIPIYRFVYKIYKTQTVRDITEFIEKFTNYMRDLMETKKKGFDEDSIHDITSMLIAVQKEAEADPSGSGMSQLAEEHFIQIIMDIFTAGSDTSRFTLDWFLQFMALYPNIQDKLYQEIMANIGKDRKISLDDRSKLPHVEATLYEVLRYRTTVPLSLPHTTTCDTTCKGYDIPAGTIVLPNIYSCHTDPEYWSDPEDFRPERFINEDGSANSVRTAFMPFSMGRRICVGETLAKATLNYTMASLIQRYEFVPVPGESLTLDSTYVAMLTAAKPYRIMVKLRP